MSIEIVAKNVVKTFDKGKVTVIPDLSLKIKNGEFFTLLGPSGCGKTTFLRMIAGFNELNGGELYFNDKPISNVPAYDRNIGMVFQNYAIFPHMNASENVAYGLKLRKTPKADIERRVLEALKTVRMEQYADRLPSKLSGGQQQRIALARAIVIDPDVLLMDEPLSNLDAKLRIEMRSSIRELQKRLGITTVYVTHDQEEALAVSDRIAVLDHGVVQQVASPQTIYQRPADVFVATFIGQSNLIRGKISLADGKKQVVLAQDCRLEVKNLRDGVQDGQDIIIAMRADLFQFVEKGGLPARIKSNTFLGKEIHYHVEFQGGIAVETDEGNQLTECVKYCSEARKVGETVMVLPDVDKINVFTADGKTNLIEGVSVYEE